jgi:Uma2 family endonuclease
MLVRVIQMGEAALRRITVDEFLAWDSGDDMRYELVDGVIVSVGIQPVCHGIIMTNAGMLIHERIKPRGHAVMAAGICPSWRNDAFYSADVVITYSPIRVSDFAIPEPVLIIEVTTPSTMAHDKAVKLADYRHIPSVQAIIFIAAEEKRVELWRRGPDLWTVIELESGGILPLDVIGFDIPVEALYEGLDLSQAAGAKA